MGDNSSDSNSDEELYLMTIGIVTAIKSKKSENTDIGLEKSIEIEMLMVATFSYQRCEYQIEILLSYKHTYFLTSTANSSSSLMFSFCLPIFFRNLKHSSSSSANNILNSPRVLKYLSLFFYYFIYLFLLNDLIIACCRHTK